MKTKILISTLALGLSAGTALAKVPENVAARLGQDLTPIGAEKAGSASGIDSWSKENRIDGSTLLAGFDGSGPLPDPFADDPILYTVTASNAAEYDAQLTAGHKALLAAYPDTYKLNVYKSRRTCVFPDDVYDMSVNNASVGMLADKGNGVAGAIGSSPFPIPNNGLEVIWNHTLRYRGVRLARDFNYAVPSAAGDYTLTFTRDEIVFAYSDPANRNLGAENLPDNLSIYFVAHTSAPARSAGNVVLVHETVNMVQQGRKAWSYSPGTRRVRRAPNIAYDNPINNGDGMGTSDQYDGYNGAPDRYDWMVVGKLEKLSQQNNFRAPLTPYSDLITPKHSNPDAHRYELRRQWVVDANLKSSARHVYARRVMRLDEDSWQITGGELYDGRGELWRIQEAGQGPDYRPVSNLCFTTGGEFSYDITSGRYMGLAMKSDRPTNIVEEGLDYLQPNYYTPANVRRLGR